MKKSKVIKITKFEQKDNYGNTSYSIEFENNDKGFFSTKDEDQKKFIIGQEAEYNIEEKTGKTGKVYYKITLPQSEQPVKSFGGGGKPQQDPKVSMISFALSYTKDLIVAGKVPISDLEKEFNKIYTLMVSKL
jgi:hypothetical protein